jgi:hypothetical protein
MPFAPALAHIDFDGITACAYALPHMAATVRAAVPAILNNAKTEVRSDEFIFFSVRRVGLRALPQKVTLPSLHRASMTRQHTFIRPAAV